MTVWDWSVSLWRKWTWLLCTAPMKESPQKNMLLPQSFWKYLFMHITKERRYPQGLSKKLQTWYQLHVSSRRRFCSWSCYYCKISHRAFCKVFSGNDFTYDIYLQWRIIWDGFTAGYRMVSWKFTFMSLRKKWHN